MTRDKDSAASTRDQILSEHREIAALTASIAGSTDSNRLVDELARLGALLEAHFRREESQEGLHEAIELRAPHHEAEVSWLEVEHREILAEVGRLQARAAEDAPDAVRRDCETLFAKMRAHEARETEVFLDSVWSDLGVGD